MPDFIRPRLGDGLECREPAQFNTPLIDEALQAGGRRGIAGGERSKLLFQHAALQSPDLRPGNDITCRRLGCFSAEDANIQ